MTIWTGAPHGAPFVVRSSSTISYIPLGANRNEASRMASLVRSAGRRSGLGPRRLELEAWRADPVGWLCWTDRHHRRKYPGLARRRRTRLARRHREGARA